MSRRFSCNGQPALALVETGLAEFRAAFSCFFVLFYLKIPALDRIKRSVCDLFLSLTREWDAKPAA